MSFLKTIFIIFLTSLTSNVLAEKSPEISIEDHLGLSLNLEKAKEMSEKGDSTAQLELGIRYRLGISVQEDLKESEKWLLRASEQNNPMAQYNLALLYFQLRDVEVGIKWLQQAANNGVVEAQTFLGHLYDWGKYIPRDYAQAMKWLRLAASKDDANAMNSIGLMYLKGKGVDQSYVEAAAWFEKAAILGQEAAQRHLGNLYADGQGVEKNYIKAYAWLTISTEQHFTPAEADRNNLVKNMSPEEIKAGESLMSSLRQSK